MKTHSMFVVLVVVATTALFTETASAQCTTCPAPTVAYQPVTYQVAQPVVTRQTRARWYPGKLLDRWRSRGLTAQQTYAVGYAPYAAAYAPYTVGYAPYGVGYAPQTVAYRPYVTSYAPLTPACNTCVQRVARPVVLQRVAAAGCAICGCDPCNCNPCGCASCPTTGVSQAIYTESAGCPTCATGAATYTPSQPNVGPQTPPPVLNDVEPAPQDSTYRTQRATEGGGNGSKVDHYPGPAEGADTSTYFDLKAPKLFDPSDRTARRSTSSRGPTVDVWNAVYRKPVTGNVSQVSQSRTQAEIDAEGWTAVSR
ncbi:MAG: hypothetical protein MI725_07290 [Pirellulales bacterium]|nr:hypothetical protein [Pirellulales bacterium]